MDVIIQLVVMIGVCGILWWLINYVGLPRPLQIVIAVIGSLIAIAFLLNLGGIIHLQWHR